MEKLKHARLFSTDQKLFVECNKEERPIGASYDSLKNNTSNLSDYAIEKKMMRIWQSNCKTVEVHPSEVERFKSVARKIWEKHTGVYDEELKSEWITFRDFLQQGILLPPDSVRIETRIIEVDVQNMYDVGKANLAQEFAFLSEEKESSETQEELWDEVRTHFHGINIPQFEKLKSKFEIKRKQG